MVAFKRSTNLRGLLVRSTLRDCNDTTRKTIPRAEFENAIIHAALPVRFTARPSQLHFTSTKEKGLIHDPLNCKSKNLIYLVECKKMQQTVHSDVHWGDQALSPRTLWEASPLHRLWL